jgi:Skp family chaperone for outer membrane proteins
MLTATLCATLLGLSTGQTAEYTRQERIECPVIDVAERHRFYPNASSTAPRYQEQIARCLTKWHEREVMLAAAKQAKKEQAQAMRRSLEDRDAAEAQAREEQAQRRQREDEDRRASEAREAELRNDPKWRQADLSRTRCAFIVERRDAVKEIATQKKYSRLGGVIDLGSLDQQQQIVRRADEQIAEAKSGLAEIGLPAIACDK